MYYITVYDVDGLEMFTKRYNTKAQQMEAYWHYRQIYKASDIEKGKYIY